MNAVDELIVQIKDDLKIDSPFDNKDEVIRYIDDCIDSALIYDSNIVEFFNVYEPISSLIPMFSRELIDDVHSKINYSDYIRKENEE